MRWYRSLRRRVSRTQRSHQQVRIARWWLRVRHNRNRAQDAITAAPLVRPHMGFSCGHETVHVNASTLWRTLMSNGQFQNPFTRQVVTRDQVVHWQEVAHSWKTRLPNLTVAFDRRDELSDACLTLRNVVDNASWEVAHVVQPAVSRMRTSLLRRLDTADDAALAREHLTDPASASASAMS